MGSTIADTHRFPTSTTYTPALPALNNVPHMAGPFHAPQSTPAHRYQNYQYPSGTQPMQNTASHWPSPQPCLNASSPRHTDTVTPSQPPQADFAIDQPLSPSQAPGLQYAPTHVNPAMPPPAALPFANPSISTSSLPPQALALHHVPQHVHSGIPPPPGMFHESPARQISGTAQVTAPPTAPQVLSSINPASSASKSFGSTPIGLQFLFPTFPIFNADRDIVWWLHQFEEMVVNCTEADKARLLILKLGERVQDTVNILPPQHQKDYNCLKRQLTETYGTPTDSGVWYATLMNRKKESTETVASYMRDIQRLVGKVKIHPTQRDQYVRDAFISGLPADLQLYLGPTKSASPGELLQAATYFEQISKKNGSWRQSPTRVFKADVRNPIPQPSFNAARPHYFSEQTRQTINSNRTPMISNCYCCGEQGHFKRNCPFLQHAFCPCCNQKGHYPQVCHSRQVNASSPSFSRPLNEQGLVPHQSSTVPGRNQTHHS